MESNKVRLFSGVMLGKIMTIAPFLGFRDTPVQRLA